MMIVDVLGGIGLETHLICRAVGEVSGMGFVLKRGGFVV